jgi:sulfur carrier protein ThiS
MLGFRARNGISKLVIAAMLVQLLSIFPSSAGHDIANAVDGQSGEEESVGEAVYGPNGETGEAPPDAPGTSQTGDALPLSLSANAADNSKLSDFTWEQITGKNLDGSPLEGQQQFIPDERHSAAMSYDEQAGNVVLFGGQTINTHNNLIMETSVFSGSVDSLVKTVDFVATRNGLTDDTWIWNGVDKTWQEIQTGTAPAARKGAAIAYDPANGQVLLFGGQGSNSLLNDTWLWDGTEQKWEQVSPATSPSARGYSQMAYYYDEEGKGRIVLFGGIAGSTRLADTWVWDGETKTWTQQSPAASPPSLYAGTMSYDGEQAVLFGGNMGLGAGFHNVAHELSNTKLWKWDGATWSSEDGPEKFEVFDNGQRAPMDYGRWGHAMAYDGKRTIYYGGMSDWVVGTNDTVMRQTRPTDGITYIDYNIGKPYTVFSRSGGEWEPAWTANGGYGYVSYLDPGTYDDIPLWPYNWAAPRTYASMAFDGTNFVVFGGIKGYMDVYDKPGGTVQHALPVQVTNETWTFGYTPPTPPLVRINEPVVALLNKETREDRVSVITDVYGNGTKPILSRGLEYREMREEGEEPAPWTSVPTTGAAGTSTGAVTVHLDNTPTTYTLEWQTPYEFRAYATNSIGTAYSQIVPFELTEDLAMEEPDVSFVRVGPAFLHTKDKKRMVAVGEGIINLLRKPDDQIHYRLRQGNDEYPLSIQIRSNSELDLTWEANLPSGTYDLVLEHDFYDDALFEGALTITSLDFYKPRNFGAVEVLSTSIRNQTDKLSLLGLFTETPEAPGLYVLGDLEEPVAINGSVMFKGSSLEVDKRSNPHTIRGNGRLYVNSIGSTGTALAYTLFEGEFELNANDFSIAAPGQAKTDYLGMGFPVDPASIAFTKDGVRLSGSIDLGFYAGNRKVDGTTSVDALDFNVNRFKLNGSFPINRPFAVGPIDATGMTWNVDSRFGYAGATAAATLPAYNMEFDMYMSIKQGRLDGIGFGMYKGAKTGSTGTELHYLFGSAEGLSGYTQLPQTFKFSGAASDVFAPERNELNLIEAYDLDIDVSRYMYRASGDMYLYWFEVADLNKMVVLNPGAAGIKGLSSPGFATSGKLNAFDLFVGPLSMTYVNKLGFMGQMKATVHIPKSIPAVGGRTMYDIPVAIDAKGMYTSFKVNDMGVKITYLFSKNMFEFELISPPPKKSWWMKALDVIDTIGTFADALDGDIEAGLDLFDMFTENIGRSGRASILSASSEPAVRTAAAPGGEPVTLNYEQKLAGEWLQPDADEAVAKTARLDGSRFTAIERVTAPDADWVPLGSSGQRIAYAFEAERPYEALLVLEGDRRNAVLASPRGQAVQLTEENVLYRDGATYLRVSLNEAGTWKLSSPEAVKFVVYELAYVNAGDEISGLVDAWTAVTEREVTMIPIQQRGRVLLTIGDTLEDAVVYKKDGRPYAIETDENAADWNAFRDSSTGLLYVLADVTETGDWLVDGGGQAAVNVYQVKPATTTLEAQEWVREGIYPTSFKLGASSQLLLQIYGADRNTVVLKPDGTEYELKTDYRKGDWNAHYDGSKNQLTVLLDDVRAGDWTVKGDSFASVKAYKLNIPFENLRPLYLKGERTREIRLQIDEPGKYMLAVIDGDASTKITAPGAKEPLPLVFDENDPASNAILQRHEDRLGANDGDIDDASIEFSIPDPGEKDVLYVTIDVEKAGVWTIAADKRIELMLTELPELPELTEASAVAKGTNSFEVKWNVDHPEAGIEVVVMVTDDPERPIGEVVAEGLPAAGVRTIDIPSGFVSGQYYLSVMARSEAWAPMVQVIHEPIELVSAETLPRPAKPELVSAGNGELTLRLQPVDDSAVSYYRVFAVKENGAPDYGKPAFDAAPDNLTLAMAGLETGQMYRFAVMAIGEKNGETAIGALSESIEAFLPIPRPAELDVELTAVVPNDAKVVERTFDTYYEEQEILLMTSAEEASVRVASSQNAKVALYVNGEFAARRSVEAGEAAVFELNGLLAADRLKERDYDLLIEAVNDDGDRSSAYRKLYVDRTGPYLYAAYAENPEESLNGLVVQAERVPIVGQTDIGSTLTVNGVHVPIDESGRFVYYAPWPETAEEGKYEVHMIAEDLSGNRTESKFEALQDSSEPVKRHAAELAALTLERGALNTSFHPDTTSYESLQQQGKVKVFAVPASGDASVTVNGIAPGEDGAVEIDVPASGRTVTIEIEGAGGSERTYTVLMSGEKSDVALLKGLELSAEVDMDDNEDTSVPLNLEFASGTSNYQAAVGHEVAEIKVKPTALEEGSAITVNGQTVPIGAAVPVALAAGEATRVTIVVTAPDGTATKTYALDVWRGGDGNAGLQQLNVADMELIPQFDANVEDYLVMVPQGTPSLNVSAVAAGEGATVRIDGQELPEAAVPLTQLVQTIEVEVAAQNGRTLTYSIKVQQNKQITIDKPPLLDELSAGTRLEEEFSPYRLNYTARATTASQATVVAKANDPDAIVTVNGKPVNKSGAAAASLKLGANVVVVRVESADRTASQSYSIAVQRDEEDNRTVRNAPVQTGKEDGMVVPIYRNVTSNGVKIDTVDINRVKAREIMNQAREGGLGYARIIVTDLPEDLADEYELSIPSIALGELASGEIRLLVSFPNTEIELSKETLERLKEQGSEVYFRIVPIRAAAGQAEAEERMLDEEIVQTAANGKEVIRIGVPLTIETNYTGYATKVTFPLEGLSLPKEAAAKRILDALTVYIEHSDGERVLRRGTIRYGEDGQPTGIEIEIEKFSTFTVVRIVDGEAELLEPYISGYPDGTFQPGRALTRAEMAAMLARSLSYRGAAATGEGAATGPSSYADVPSGHWAADAIAQVSGQGLMTGDGVGAFRPSDVVTRAEIAAIAVRWSGLTGAEAPAGFSDTLGHWAETLIARTKSEGIMNGYPDGTFRPEAPLLRAEAVRVLNALFGRPLPIGFGTSIWPDVPASHWAYRDIVSASNRIRLFSDGSAQMQREEN